MPNWCSNTLNISHKDPQMIRGLYDAYLADSMLNFAVPMPPEFNENGKWYDWRVQTWGTKWDISHSDSTAIVNGDKAMFSFASAWGPPIEAMRALAEKGYQITMYYIEPGMCFAGYCHGDADGFHDESGDFENLPPNVAEYYEDALNEYKEWENA
jgi:hypothetical protein